MAWGVLSEVWNRTWVVWFAEVLIAAALAMMMMIIIVSVHVTVREKEKNVLENVQKCCGAAGLALYSSCIAGCTLCN